MLQYASYDAQLGFFFFFQDNSQNAPLVEATLGTLLKFLNWIPLGYIFETPLIQTLATKVQYALMLRLLHGA